MEKGHGRNRIRFFFCLIWMGLLCVLLTGCQKASPAQARSAFLGCLNSGDYQGAYQYLAAGVRYDEETAQADLEAGREQSKKRISEEQFVNKYQAIFEELDITGFTYTVTSAQEENEIIAVYDYTLLYESEKLGQEPLDFRMTMLREDGEWKVDWDPSLIFPEMDWGDTVRVGTLKASRGEIIAGGEVLAETVDAVSITCVPSKIEDREQFLRQTSLLLEMDMAEVEKAVDRAYNDFAILKQLYPDQLTEALEEQLLLIPGVGIDTSNYGELRYYPHASSMAHLLGYVRTADEQDLKDLTGGELNEQGQLVDPETGNVLENAAYNADSVVGKAGLERQYEKELRGSDGYYIFICAEDGTNKGVLYREPAQNGMDLQLTIEPGLQNRVETLLSLTLFGDDTAGAVVVMDPHTGYLEAAASYPSYDLNKYVRGWSAAEWEDIQSKANTPLYNRLTQGRYPPGSILKPFTAAAALESGAMTAETEFPANEVIEENKWRPSDDGEFGPWGYSFITRIGLRNRHLPLNMYAGIVDSDNIYFAYAALRTGIENFEAYMQKIGMAEKMPFELNISTPQLKNEDRMWDNGLLADSSFGQGEILITPLQAAATFCAFANGGTIMQPHIVKGLYRNDGTDYLQVEATEPQVWKENVVAQSSIDTIEPMLKAVVDDGTGYNLNYAPDKLNKNGDPGVYRSPRMDNIAAKTGTAQVGGDKSREISWFVGYRLGVEKEDARLVLVMLEIPANDTRYSNLKYDIAHDLLKPEG